MKTYYVRKSATTYAFALILAEGLKQAREIANCADISDMMEETECYELDHIAEISTEEAQDYGVPTLKQTKEGYKVI